MGLSFVDAHCHLHSPWFIDDIGDVIKRALDKGVNKIVNCSSDPSSFQEVIASNDYDQISITLGLQPTLSNKFTDASALEDIEGLEKLVVGIGEVGLDYYWIKDESLRKRQEELFISAIQLSNETNLPVIVHSRKAETECLEILEKHARTPVLLHSFDGNLKEITTALDLGYMITVPTIVTRRKNRKKVTVRSGLDNIMIETDSPFCTTSEEIKRNEPSYIPVAAEYMAKILEVDIAEVADVTTKNAEKFYQI